jgi:outer membrane immunogenic protein
MKKYLLSALLASVAFPAFAADMPVKAPRIAEAPFSDWSGFYVGFSAGYGWGRQKWDGSSVFEGGTFESDARTPATGFPATLFTSRVFLPDFDTPLTSSLKNRGWVAGGFFGAQKQWGNWVFGRCRCR